MTDKRLESVMLSRRALAKTVACAAAAATLPNAANAAANAVTEQPVSNEPSPPSLPARQSWTKIYPGIWRARIGSPEEFTPVSTRTKYPVEGVLANLPAPPGATPLNAPLAIIDRRGTTVFLTLEAGENLYGFGLQMYSFNQRGKMKKLRVNADPRIDTGDSHAPVPFYVSSKGYGIFVDTARCATFCCGTAQRAEARAGKKSEAEITFDTQPQDVSSEYVTVQVDEAKGVDVYLFGGPTMLDVVRRYNLFSGGGVSPPEWGLGVWYRTQVKADSDEVLRFAQEFRERKIPCDVIGIEPGWQTHAYSCSYMWGNGFPNPTEFVRSLDAMNYKVNLWEHAFVHSSAPFHDEIAPQAGDYLVWQGLVPDFQNQKARQIFGGHHRKSFIDIGVSGFKLDECDNSDFTGGWSFPEFSRFPSGQDGEQMHAVFGLRYQQTLLEQFEAAGTPTYGLARSSGALASPYPFALYSDLYDHRAFVRSLVNSGFSGLLWCPEVRDASGPQDLLRRLQTAVFSPLAMINGWYIANPPWKQQDKDKNNANQFEPGWEALEAQCREVLEWRMMLLPYLRAAFARYEKDATPPFRALVMDDQTDRALANCDDQFMVGDRIMVAPLFDGEASRKVILPRGDWHDLWTGTPIMGGQIVEVPKSYERIPVYIKTNCVMPLGGIGNWTSDTKTRNLTVRIFGDGSLPFRIDGDKQAELVLSWKDGVGKTEQRTSASPYTVVAWQP